MLPIGQITLGKEVIASDPCYEVGTWCAKQLDITPGTYDCYVEQYGGRISSLIISHHEEHEETEAYEDKYLGSVGVDSGQFGFFDADYFKENQPDDDFDDTGSWYRRVCDITLLKERGTIEGKGVVSSSGYGDGSYDIYATCKKGGEIVGLKVEYI